MSISVETLGQFYRKLPEPSPEKPLSIVSCLKALEDLELGDSNAIQKLAKFVKAVTELPEPTKEDKNLAKWKEQAQAIADSVVKSRFFGEIEREERDVFLRASSNNVHNFAMRFLELGRMAWNRIRYKHGQSKDNQERLCTRAVTALHEAVEKLTPDQVEGTGLSTIISKEFRTIFSAKGELPGRAEFGEAFAKTLQDIPDEDYRQWKGVLGLKIVDSKHHTASEPAVQEGEEKRAVLLKADAAFRQFDATLQQLNSRLEALSESAQNFGITLEDSRRRIRELSTKKGALPLLQNIQTKADILKISQWCSSWEAEMGSADQLLRQIEEQVEAAKRKFEEKKKGLRELVERLPGTESLLRRLGTAKTNDELRHLEQQISALKSRAGEGAGETRLRQIRKSPQQPPLRQDPHARSALVKEKTRRIFDKEFKVSELEAWKLEPSVWIDIVLDCASSYSDGTLRKDQAQPVLTFFREGILPEIPQENRERMLKDMGEKNAFRDLRKQTTPELREWVGLPPLEGRQEPVVRTRGETKQLPPHKPPETPSIERPRPEALRPETRQGVGREETLKEQPQPIGTKAAQEKPRPEKEEEVQGKVQQPPSPAERPIVTPQKQKPLLVGQLMLQISDKDFEIETLETAKDQLRTEDWIDIVCRCTTRYSEGTLSEKTTQSVLEFVRDKIIYALSPGMVQEICTTLGSKKEFKNIDSPQTPKLREWVGLLPIGRALSPAIEGERRVTRPPLEKPVAKKPSVTSKKPPQKLPAKQDVKATGRGPKVRRQAEQKSQPPVQSGQVKKVEPPKIEAESPQREFEKLKKELQELASITDEDARTFLEEEVQYVNEIQDIVASEGAPELPGAMARLKEVQQRMESTAERVVAEQRAVQEKAQGVFEQIEAASKRLQGQIRSIVETAKNFDLQIGNLQSSVHELTEEKQPFASVRDVRTKEDLRKLDQWRSSLEGKTHKVHQIIEQLQAQAEEMQRKFDARKKRLTDQAQRNPITQPLSEKISLAKNNKDLDVLEQQITEQIQRAESKGQQIEKDLSPVELSNIIDKYIEGKAPLSAALWSMVKLKAAFKQEERSESNLWWKAQNKLLEASKKQERATQFLKALEIFQDFQDIIEESYRDPVTNAVMSMLQQFVLEKEDGSYLKSLMCALTVNLLNRAGIPPSDLTHKKISRELTDKPSTKQVEWALNKKDRILDETISLLKETYQEASQKEERKRALQSVNEEKPQRDLLKDLVEYNVELDEISEEKWMEIAENLFQGYKSGEITPNATLCVMVALKERFQNKEKDLSNPWLVARSLFYNGQESSPRIVSFREKLDILENFEKIVDQTYRGQVMRGVMLLLQKVPIEAEKDLSLKDVLGSLTIKLLDAAEVPKTTSEYKTILSQSFKPLLSEEADKLIRGEQEQIKKVILSLRTAYQKRCELLEKAAHDFDRGETNTFLLQLTKDQQSELVPLLIENVLGKITNGITLNPLDSYIIEENQEQFLTLFIKNYQTGKLTIGKALSTLISTKILFQNQKDLLKNPWHLLKDAVLNQKKDPNKLGEILRIVEDFELSIDSPYRNQILLGISFALRESKSIETQSLQSKLSSLTQQMLTPLATASPILQPMIDAIRLRAGPVQKGPTLPKDVQESIEKIALERQAKLDGIISSIRQGTLFEEIPDLSLNEWNFLASQLSTLFQRGEIPIANALWILMYAKEKFNTPYYASMKTTPWEGFAKWFEIGDLPPKNEKLRSLFERYSILDKFENSLPIPVGYRNLIMSEIMLKISSPETIEKLSLESTPLLALCALNSLGFQFDFKTKSLKTSPSPFRWEAQIAQQLSLELAKIKSDDIPEYEMRQQLWSIAQIHRAPLLDIPPEDKLRERLYRLEGLEPEGEVEKKRVSPFDILLDITEPREEVGKREVSPEILLGSTEPEKEPEEPPPLKSKTSSIEKIKTISNQIKSGQLKISNILHFMRRNKLPSLTKEEWCILGEILFRSYEEGDQSEYNMVALYYLFKETSLFDPRPLQYLEQLMGSNSQKAQALHKKLEIFKKVEHDISETNPKFAFLPAFMSTVVAMLSKKDFDDQLELIISVRALRLLGYKYSCAKRKAIQVPERAADTLVPASMIRGVAKKLAKIISALSPSEDSLTALQLQPPDVPETDLGVVVSQRGISLLDFMEIPEIDTYFKQVSEELLLLEESLKQKRVALAGMGRAAPEEEPMEHKLEEQARALESRIKGLREMRSLIHQEEEIHAIEEEITSLERQLEPIRAKIEAKKPKARSSREVLLQDIEKLEAKRAILEKTKNIQLKSISILNAQKKGLFDSPVKRTPDPILNQALVCLRALNLLGWKIKEEGGELQIDLERKESEEYRSFVEKCRDVIIQCKKKSRTDLISPLMESQNAFMKEWMPNADVYVQYLSKIEEYINGNEELLEKLGKEDRRYLYCSIRVLENVYNSSKPAQKLKRALGKKENLTDFEREFSNTLSLNHKGILQAVTGNPKTFMTSSLWHTYGNMKRLKEIEEKILSQEGESAPREEDLMGRPKRIERSRPAIEKARKELDALMPSVEELRNQRASDLSFKIKTIIDKATTKDKWAQSIGDPKEADKLAAEFIDEFKRRSSASPEIWRGTAGLVGNLSKVTHRTTPFLYDALCKIPGFKARLKG
jgi:hypothetical protein